jgi:hypothetical protein
MKLTHLRGVVFAVIVSTLLFSGRAAAQAPLEPAQMPSRTSFYLIWRGTPAPDVRKANSLLGLWDDPDFAPVRSAMFENMNSSEKDASKQKLTREEVEKYSSLLENAIVLGYISKPEAKTAASAAPPKAAEHPWNGAFFVYDRTGKEKLLSEAMTRLRAQGKDAPQLSQITIAGVPALRVDNKTDTPTYWVEHGKYAAGATERSVLEELLPRLEGKAPAAASLAQSAAYQEAQPLLGGGLLEFFIRIPNLKTLIPDSNPSAVQIAPVLDAMKLEAVHSFCGRVILEGAKTRMQAALLGDAAPGTLFDLWGAGQQSPVSLSLLSPTAISYSQTQFNLAAFYEMLKHAFTAALPPNQQGSVAMMEGLGQNRLGMPITDALGLLSGDFASMQTSPSLDPLKAVYVLGIRKKPEALKLIHTIFSDQVSSERNEGDTTYLKISLGGGQGNAGVVQYNFYHLAVTPDFILGAGRSETLHEFMAARAQGSASTNLATNAKFKAARAAYPEKLDGLDYFDFQKVDWQALKTRWVEEAKKLSEKQNATGSPKAVPAKVPNLLNDANPQVFPRHLHFMAGASWKDAKGIHFDQWLD